MLSHMILPLVAIPLTFFLIPRARMTDDLIHDPAHGAREEILSVGYRAPRVEAHVKGPQSFVEAQFQFEDSN